MKSIEEITIEFFRLRFPNKKIEFEKKCGYFQEWDQRFIGLKPEPRMDALSLSVWKSMQKWIHS